MMSKIKLSLFLILLMTACSRHVSQPQQTVLKLPARPIHTETIVIDAGHGGKDSGSLSQTYDYEEKKLTLSMAKMLRDYLQEMGYKAILTREDDTYVTLDSRAELANSQNVNLFVSVHCNHCPDASVEGIEIFYYRDEREERRKNSRNLGDAILSQMVYHTGAEARGLKMGKFAVVRQTKMPAVLVETGFLSHPKEREKLKDPMYRRFLAKGIARGIDKYFDHK